MKSKFFKAGFIYISAIALLAVLFVTLQLYQDLSAENSEVCLACHEDMDLTMDKNGKKISLYVEPKRYESSVHGGAACVDCHTGYNPDVIPHTTTPVNVNCRSCHDDAKAQMTGLHSKINCADCHTKHDIKPAKEMAKNQTQNCLKCHNRKNVQAFKTSAHSKKNVGCESCHQSGHNTKNIAKSEVVHVCGKCHGSHERNFNNSVHQTVLKSGNPNAPACTDCHGYHGIVRSKVSIESESCLKCHLDEKMFPETAKNSAKFVAEYRTSVHASIEKGGKEAAGCVDCHGSHMISGPSADQPLVTGQKIADMCGKCHGDISAKYLTSQHGRSLLDRNVAAPNCVSCHNEHSIKAIKKADEFTKINQVDMCLNCHQNQKLPHKSYLGEEVLISHYKDSYHYQALQEGNLDAATCSDCHGAHEMAKFDDPNSTIYKKNIEKTCGQSNCHVKQLTEFQGSIHEVAISQKNNFDSPTCTNCHGNHQILRKDTVANVRLSNRKGLVQLCSSCHSSVEMIEKYDLPVGRGSTYRESFHGLAVRGGSKEAADCGSCHGYHNVRPSSDPLSTVSKENLAQTCGTCHPGATQTFLTSKIHVVNPKEDTPVLYWLTVFYIVFIGVIIGGMLLHNMVDFFKKFKEKDDEEEEEEIIVQEDKKDDKS